MKNSVLLVAMFAVTVVPISRGQTIHTFERVPDDSPLNPRFIDVAGWATAGNTFAGFPNAPYHSFLFLGNGPSGPGVADGSQVVHGGGVATASSMVTMAPDLQPSVNVIEQHNVNTYVHTGMFVIPIAFAHAATGVDYDFWVRNDTPLGNTETPFEGVEVTIDWGYTGVGIWAGAGCYEITVNDAPVYVFRFGVNNAGGWAQLEVGGDCNNPGIVVERVNGTNGGSFSFNLPVNPGDPQDPTDRGDMVGARNHPTPGLSENSPQSGRTFLTAGSIAPPNLGGPPPPPTFVNGALGSVDIEFSMLTSNDSP